MSAPVPHVRALPCGCLVCRGGGVSRMRGRQCAVEHADEMRFDEQDPARARQTEGVIDFTIPPLPAGEYVIGVDVARKGGDHSVATKVWRVGRGAAT